MKFQDHGAHAAKIDALKKKLARSCEGMSTGTVSLAMLEVIVAYGSLPQSTPAFRKALADTLRNAAQAVERGDAPETEASSILLLN